MALPSRTDCAPWASATSPSPQARLGRTASPKGCECVDHLVVLGETHLRRVLTKYAAYYNELRPEVRLRASAKGEVLDKIFRASPPAVQTSALARIHSGKSLVHSGTRHSRNKGRSSNCAIGTDA